jgi:secreted trypsin-like serine protease
MYLDSDLSFGQLAKLNRNGTDRQIDHVIGLGPLIVGGIQVQRGAMPWMAAITKYQHNKLPRWRVVCGGIVLSRTFIITAAHCVKE